MIDYWATIKAFFRDRHNQKKMVRLFIFVSAVIIGTAFYSASPDRDMMDGAKYVCGSVGRMETVTVGKYLSSESDPAITKEYTAFFNADTPLTFYKEAYKQYSFIVIETSMENNDVGTVTVNMTLPNFKLAYKKIFPEGAAEYLGENPTFETLCSAESKDFYAKLTEAMEDGTITFTSVPVTFDCVKEDGEWLVILDETDLDAFTGFLLSATGVL